MNDGRVAHLAEASQQRGEHFMAPNHIRETSLHASCRPLRRHPLGQLVDRAEIIGFAAIEVMVKTQRQHSFGSNSVASVSIGWPPAAASAGLTAASSLASAACSTGRSGGSQNRMAGSGVTAGGRFQPLPTVTLRKPA